MHSTFNCGYGYLIVVPGNQSEALLAELQKLWQSLPFDPMTDEKPAALGKIVQRQGDKSVIFLDE